MGHLQLRLQQVRLQWLQALQLWQHPQPLWWQQLQLL